MRSYEVLCSLAARFCGKVWCASLEVLRGFWGSLGGVSYYAQSLLRLPQDSLTTSLTLPPCYLKAFHLRSYTAIQELSMLLHDILRQDGLKTVSRLLKAIQDCLKTTQSVPQYSLKTVSRPSRYRRELRGLGRCMGRARGPVRLVLGPICSMND